MKVFSWKKTVSAVVGTVLTLSAIQATAGDVLRFKQGELNSNNLASSPIWIRDALQEESKNARFFVVQFSGVITASDRQNLSSLGIKVLRYIPDDALLVEANAKLAKTIEKSSSTVRLVVPYFPQWKESPEFGPSSVFNADELETIYVRLFSDSDNADVTERIARLRGVKIEQSVGRVIAATVKRSSLREIAKVEGVEWIQRMPEIQNFMYDEPLGVADPMAGDYTDLDGYEDGTKIMKFDVAWARGFTGQGQITSMADTGLDTGNLSTLHADFKGRVPKGYNFGLFASSWEDPMGHGTHVAGSVMGGGAASGGKIKGGAYQAQMIPDGMWSPMLNNLTVPSKLADLFKKPYADGARIHTNSWGSPMNPGVYDAFAQQVDEFAFANPDMLILFAAGNDGKDTDKDGRIDPGSVATPGTAKNALTVGASQNLVSTGGIQKTMRELREGTTKWGAEPIASSKLSANENGMAAFSSRGPTSDGRTKPEIVAPGTNVLSNKSQHKDAELLWGKYNDDYVWSGGTSMSTPLVAGAAAVVREYLVKDRKVASPSAALMKAVLLHTATDMFPGQFGNVGRSRGQEFLNRRPNSDEGFGRVNMDKATALNGVMIFDEKAGVAQGEQHRYPIKVSSKGKLVATLVYTDAPGSPSVTKTLVNDVDVAFVAANGVETALSDDTNNSRLLELDNASGDYEVVVKGSNVPNGAAGKQPYALVVSVE